VIEATNPTESYELVYDADGRLTDVERDSTTETSYVYDGQTGLLTDLTDAAGTTSYTYDGAGQVSTLDDPFATSGVSTYSYDPTTGRLETRVDGQSNLTWTTGYDPDTGRLDATTIDSTSPSTTLAAFELGFDKAGNVVAKDSDVFSNPSDGSWAYDYDGAGRLIEATGPNASGNTTTWDYAYDGGGNRIEMTETTGQSVVSDLSTSYDARGLPVSASDAQTGESIDYDHDEIGSLLQIDSSIGAHDAAYAYDPYARMTCAEPGATQCAGAGSVAYALDAFDRALSRTDGAGTTSYAYRGTGEQLATSTSGQTTTAYAYGTAGAPLAQKVGSADASYTLVDTHADVVGLVSETATEVGTAAYDPWGEPLATSGTQSALGYQGDVTDPDTGLVDMGTRWYAPGLGRFGSRDTVFGELSSPMTMNQYAYGGMNPITMWDPTGMGQCVRPLECVTNGGKAVGGNPGAANHPQHSCGCVVSGHAYAPAPPPPESASAINYARVQRAIDLSPRVRLWIMSSFFDVFPGTYSTGRYGFGKGIIDFTAWERTSGRLDLSTWWRASNGLMVLDIKQAMRELSRGNGRSQNPGVQAWIDYARTAIAGVSRASQQAVLWRAHQVSLHSAFRSQHVNRFIGSEHTSSPFNLATNESIVRNVDHAALSNWPTDTPILGHLAQFYGGYPADGLSALLADASDYGDSNTGIYSTRRW
jgi:RHS repeat-associated protein